jgi:hypothetical protein
LPARSSTHRRMRLGEVAAALALIPTSHLRP